MSGEEMIRTAVVELERLISTKNVVGEPIVMGERVMVPISSYGFGFGGGHGTAGEGQEGIGGGGSGVGAAAGVNPIAVVVLDGTVAGPTGVQVHLLRKRSELAEVVSTLSSSLVPQVIDAITTKRGTASSPASPPAREGETPSSPSGC